jgi:hypothetical protein
VELGTLDVVPQEIVFVSFCHQGPQPLVTRDDRASARTQRSMLKHRGDLRWVPFAAMLSSLTFRIDGLFTKTWQMASFWIGLFALATGPVIQTGYCNGWECGCRCYGCRQYPCD